MGIWDWFANRIDHFIHDPTDNVNTGQVANPFLVKKTPDASHYTVGHQFGDIDGTVQQTSTELWANSDVGLVHVGVNEPDESKPSYFLAAITNGMLRLVPEGEKLVVPGTDRFEATKVEVDGPAYVLSGISTAVDSFHQSLNADVWIEGGLAPPNRPVPSVIVYENVDISSDLDELIETWYRLEKKLPWWTDTKIDELVASWKAGESTAYVKAGYPIGQPRAALPASVTRPSGVAADARYVKVTVCDEFGCPIDLGWLLRHVDVHAENTIFDNLVVPNVEVFRKDPVRNKLTRRDIIDLRDEHGLPYRSRAFRRFDEGDLPAISSVFDIDEATLVLANEPESTGPSGLWVGPTVAAAAQVVTQGVGLKDHLLAFLPNCASSSVIIRLRGYPGDYHRIIALPLNKWFPEQPNARADGAPQRFHLGCRVTPLVDGQVSLATIADAIRATFERADDDPPSAIGLRQPDALAEARVWLCNWQVSLATFPYGGSQALFDSVDPDLPGNPDFRTGLFAYPLDSLGFYIQSAIAAGVDVRLLPWFNLLGDDERGKNVEFAKAVNQFYDLNAYHTATGPLADVARAGQNVTGLDPIPSNLRRGFGIVDDKTRGVGSHHQKVSFIRNRHGDFAFLGGIDLASSRWDTIEHRTGEPRGEGTGWHDVHVMLEGPVVEDLVKNFVQRWNAFLADAPDPQSGYPVDLTGVTPIQSPPQVPEEGVPQWLGPNSDLDPAAPITPHSRLDRGPSGRRLRRGSQICAVVRTIPPFIDAYDSFVKARPIPDNGEPLGELGCRVSYAQAIANARKYVYIEDQYFIEPELTEALIGRLTDPDPKKRLKRLFVIVPHILSDDDVNDAIYHHFRTKHSLQIREAVRQMLAQENGMVPEMVEQKDIDSIFTIAHLQDPSGTEIYLHAKHMIVDDIWMVISSSNFSRRGMTYETEIGVTVSDAEVEDGVRKSVRDHRIRLWAEHLRLKRTEWHRLLDPLAGVELLRQGIENPLLPLIPFEIINNNIDFRYDPENHSSQHELVYQFISDPDGRIDHDLVDVQTARAALEALKGP